MHRAADSSAHATRAARGVSVARATLSGFCASLIGIGLARFAYTPLLPAIVDAHWFAPALAAIWAPPTWPVIWPAHWRADRPPRNSA